MQAAGGLAAAGVVLGVAGAYLTLVAGLHSIDDLTPVPVFHLLAMIIGTPIVAAAAGWVFSGCQPAAVDRQPLG